MNALSRDIDAPRNVPRARAGGKWGIDRPNDQRVPGFPPFFLSSRAIVRVTSSERRGAHASMRVMNYYYC
jgi:hypothetical protein